MYVDGIDHFVLTVKDIDTTCAFYERVLGIKTVIFGGNRKALTFGTQKINLHQRGKEFEPKAKSPTPGAADFCLITSIPISDVVAHLSTCGVRVLEGPVQKIGARGPMVSVYLRDPDQNLIEVSNYAHEDVHRTAD
ncbi:MAG: VOC family protein [Desulfobacterales bacterium]|nr:VOC family protein [Desulfobacterales bacterium]